MLNAKFPIHPVHTPAHFECPACAFERDRALMLVSPDASFEDAAEAYFSYRKIDVIPGKVVQYKRPNTLKADRRQIESLKLFFAGMRLGDIRWFHMRAYQQARAAGAEPFLRFRRPQDALPRKAKGGIVVPPLGKTPCSAKPQQVNQETAFLKRLKSLAGCWTLEDQRMFMGLQEEESEIPRALTPDEQVLWLEVARSHPDWEIVYLYSLIAFDTCCSPNELRMLRFGDIKLSYDLVSVPWPAAKNKKRHREVAGLQPETHWAFHKLIARAQSLGAGDPVLCPAHCLFPIAIAKGKYDPTRPMSDSGLKKRWERVRLHTRGQIEDRAVDLSRFRIEDTRHTGATRLAERGMPADVIMARMGHVRPEMRLHYTHISEHVQRGWMHAPRFGPQSVDPRAPWGSALGRRVV